MRNTVGTVNVDVITKIILKKIIWHFKNAILAI